MVMVPVPDSQTVMALPVSASSQPKVEPTEAAKDEQQARDLLCWNDDGIGVLDGCDLRFRINQLGCLELLDSDDESENQSTLRPNAISKNSHRNISNSATKKTSTISPGASLLRDGPNIKRPKTSSSNHTQNSVRASTNNNLALQRRIEHYQNTILLEKLVPKQKLVEIKSNVENWSVEDVRNFVDSIPGCAGHGELFESQQICGKSLLHLDQRDLLDVINIKLGPAVKIYHAISLLK